MCLHQKRRKVERGELDQRNPSAVGAILTHPEMSCEIIANGEEMAFSGGLFRRKEDNVITK